MILFIFKGIKLEQGSFICYEVQSIGYRSTYFTSVYKFGNNICYFLSLENLYRK